MSMQAGRAVDRCTIVVPPAPFQSDLPRVYARTPWRDGGVVVWWHAPACSASRMLRNVPADSVEDVVQETLLEAWTHLDRLSAPEGFHLWLDEICRNVCRRHARKHRTELQLSPPLEEDGEVGLISRCSTAISRSRRP